VLTGKFTRQLRLTSPSDYKEVFNDPRRFKSTDQIFLVLARKNSLPHARLGLAISAKHLKKSVDRNRVKRQVRESFRINQEKLAGLDIVVLSRIDTLRAENNNIRKSLDRHWVKMTEQCKNF